MNITSCPLVSIVCETYNHEKYVRDCIEGFLMQKVNFEYEILIHDDASTDNTQAIIKEYESRYPDIIKPIYQTVNQCSKGIRIWYEIQFQRAKGKYIALCEGDDYWTDPYNLQKQVDFLESNPTYSLCFHNAVVHHENGSKPDYLFASLQTREYDIKENIGNWIIPTASLVFRRSVINSPYFKEVRASRKIIVCDYPMIQICAKEGRIYGLSDPMSVYRKHSTGWTQQRDFSGRLTLMFINQELEYRRIFGGYHNTYAPKAIAHHSSAAVSLFFKGKFKQAFKIWSLALRNAPWPTIKANVRQAIHIITDRYIKTRWLN